MQGFIIMTSAATPALSLIYYLQVRQGSPDRKIGAVHAQRSRSDSKACLDDLCIEGVGPPMALVHI